MHKERLLNVAKALRESENPKQFSMRREMNDCGTPACAWGHYCARDDLQRTFTMDRDGYAYTADAGGFTYQHALVREHFGITEDQAVELFSQDGCGDAKTAIAAAEYIERFVAEHGAT